MSDSLSDLVRRNKNYRIFTAAGIVSLMGDWFGFIAVFTMLKDVFGAGASAFGLVFIIKQLPMLFVSPFAGVLADKYKRRLILIYCDIARGVLVAGFLLSPLVESVWFVYSIFVLHSMLSALSETTRPAFVTEIVESRDMLSAGTLSSMIWSSTLMLGSALGGLTIELTGWSNAMVIDACSFFVSALFLNRIKEEYSKDVDSHKEEEGYRGVSSLRRLYVYLRSNHQILAISLIKGGFCLGGAMFLLLTVLGQQVYTIGQSGALGVSVLFVARGFGVLLGPVTFRHYVGSDQSKIRSAISVSFFVSALFYVLLGEANNIWAACVCILFAHAASSILFVFSTTLLQIEVPQRLRGRVFGFEMAIFTLTSALSTMFYGMLVDDQIMSPQSAVMIMGATWCLPGVAWYMLQKRLWSKSNA